VHNVLNATAAIAVGVGLDIPLDAIRTALDQFRGVDRRFQLRGTAAAVSVIDDYGHHPTEIKATLAAARQCGFRKIHVIFQPHRYTRTRDLLDDFSAVLAPCDPLFITEVYAAGEAPISGADGRALCRAIRARGGNPVFVENVNDLPALLTETLRANDVLLTLGAGNIGQVAASLPQRLGEKQ
jgi:UDP-N-acetylmuramate--alanine ligase